MKTEANVIQEVAEQYRSDGYDVIVAPASNHVPEFLANFQPDLLAYKGDEHVVVEVKVKNRVYDASSAYLAGLVNAQPGWRFDLFVVNDSCWPDDVAVTANEQSPEGIASMARSADMLDRMGQVEAACLLAWAATEASLRNLAIRHKINVARYAPIELIQSLYSSGLLSFEQYKQLRAIMKIRNAVAHGLNTKGSVNGSVSYLVGISQELLAA